MSAVIVLQLASAGASLFALWRTGEMRRDALLWQCCSNAIASCLNIEAGLYLLLLQNLAAFAVIGRGLWRSRPVERVEPLPRQTVYRWKPAR